MAVALPALGVAVVTYRDQQEINRSQLEMAQLERERYARRYASRVAFWWESPPLPGPLYGGRPGQMRESRIKVQNRSPVPITRMALLVKPYGGSFGVRDYRLTVDAPPCSVLTIALPALIDDDAFWGERHGHELMLEFADTTHRWVLREGGLEDDSEQYHRYSVFDIQNMAWASEVPDTREAAADCGEGL
ncbi:hypothetical protein [Micromonospora costi]|nr:hypothetical protein [Micromonospora costi]